MQYSIHVVQKQAPGEWQCNLDSILTLNMHHHEHEGVMVFGLFFRAVAFIIFTATVTMEIRI